MDLVALQWRKFSKLMRSHHSNLCGGWGNRPNDAWNGIFSSTQRKILAET
jgi:hypothetical protein